MPSHSPKSFEDAYEDEVWHVYGFFGYRVRSREEAEDLTQQTFERALRAWSRFDPSKGSERTWLLAIARNLLVDHYRRGRSAHEQPLAEDHSELGFTEAAHRMGLSVELETALQRLGQRERELIALRFGGDLTGPEIADTMGLSLANVQQILSRALRRLHSELDGLRPQ